MRTIQRSMEDLFEQFKFSGTKPEALTGATEKQRKGYAEYLQRETLV